MRNTLESDDIEQINKSVNELGQLVQGIGAAAYEAVDETPIAEPEGPPSNEDVIEGEFSDQD